MSFDIKINVDGAEAMVQKTEAALDDAAAAGKRAKESIGAFGQAGAVAGEAVSAGATAAAASVDKATKATKFTVQTFDQLKAAVAQFAKEAQSPAVMNGGTPTEGAKRSQRDFVGQMEREAEILKRIRGPMQEYKADLDALDRMLAKGALEAHEYNAELERLIKKQGTWQGPIQQVAKPAAEQQAPEEKKGPGIGEGIGVVLGAYAAIGIAEGLGKLRDAVEHWQDLKDVYIEVTNAAIKFVDATHDVNRVVDEQNEIAHALHGSFEATIDAYDTLRDGTDDLNFSHNEQIRMLKTIAEAARVSGKSVGEMGGMVTKLSYAAARGSIEQRELNGIMRESPDIAAVWLEKFGTSRKGLIQAMHEGKITTTDLMDAFVTETAKVDENFKKIQRTNKQIREEFEKTIEMYVSKGDARGTAIAKALQLQKTGKVTDLPEVGDFDSFVKWTNRPIKEGVRDFIAAADDVAAASARAGTAIFNQLTKNILEMAKAIPIAVGKMGELVDIVGRGAGIFADPWASDKTGFGAQLKLLGSIKNPIEEAKLQLQNLHELQAKGAISAEEYRKQYDGLMTTINDGRLPDAIRLWEQMNNPVKELALSVGGLNHLFRAGMVDAGVYVEQLRKLYGEQGEGPSLQQITHAERAGQLGPRTMGGLGVNVTVDNPRAGLMEESRDRTSARIRAAAVGQQQSAADLGPSIREMNEDLNKAFAAAERVQSPALEYEEALKQIGDASEQLHLPQSVTNELTRQAADAFEDATRRMHGQHSILQALEAPQKAYNDGLREAGELLHDHLIDAAQYTDQVDRLRATYLASSEAGKTFAGGMEAAWLKLRAEADAFGATLATTLVGDVDKLNEALVTAANGGEVAWGSMVDSMIQDLERLLIKQLEVMAITAVLNSFAPGAGSAAAGSGLTGASVDALGGALGGGASGGIGSSASALSSPGAYPMPSVPSSPATAGAAAPAPSLKIVNIIDPSVVHAAMTSREGEQIIVNTMRKNGR